MPKLGDGAKIVPQYGHAICPGDVDNDPLCGSRSSDIDGMLTCGGKSPVFLRVDVVAVFGPVSLAD